MLRSPLLNLSRRVKLPRTIEVSQLVFLTTTSNIPKQKLVFQNKIQTSTISGGVLPRVFTPRLPTENTRRNLSAKPPPPQDGDKSTSSQGKGDETTSEIVLTPGQKVVAGANLAMWGGIMALAATCMYYIVTELMPTKMSPNSVFDGAFALVKDDQTIVRRFGGPLKAYGRDHGGKREGRRNFVDNTQYTDQQDGSKRTQIRFNLEGQYGKAFVFAEVSSDMPSGEFVYLMVQDKRNGHVITLIDNRAALKAKQLAGGDSKGQEAFANLLKSKK
eukprot:CAMPEP_0184854884 /NCGR_PEP_ID=MMETSP0580-20130426/259_1 /TAXON_ID=1118495 /ORGANISM="Dactyliosolen fragilissimus" /LENGTH=273 /DNA_ID=CAMNT_0027349247 /DNA_START=26 /DNA_END=847 /DNA_ORIENTATION=+